MPLSKIPSALIHSLQGVQGFDQEAFEQVHASGEQNTSIRLNTRKLSRIAGEHSPDTLFKELTVLPVPWSSAGYYLSARPFFTIDPLFHGGAYYVQEASSMFLEEAIRQCVDLSKPVKALDLCAAPGGKSTLIQSVLHENSLLVSNEVIKTRATILAENITKWGAANVIVTNNDPKDFQRMPAFFDLVVVDAPCSGSGLFRKDPAAIDEWSEQNVMLCSQRQQRILADVLPSLKDGGILIYSTCSYSFAENEVIGDWLIKECQLTSIPLQLKAEWNIVETVSPEAGAFGYRFYPDKLKGEGFFIAAFIKGQKSDEDGYQKKLKLKSEKSTPAETLVLKPWLKQPEDFFFFKQQESVLALPIHLENDLALIQRALYIKKAGVKIGIIIRNELVPDHELAVSSIISTSITTIETRLETALQYLRRQEINMDPTIKGWALISFGELPLGWIKVLANRVNNYYPKEWRILHK